MLRDPSMSSDIHHATPTPITQLELDGLAEHPRASSTIVHMDDPDHGRVRKLMAEPFRVREISRSTPLDRGHGSTTALDRLRARARRRPGRRSTSSREFAYPLPVEIFSHLARRARRSPPPVPELDELGRPQPRPDRAGRARGVLRRPRRHVRLPGRAGRGEAAEPRPTTCSRTWCTSRTADERLSHDELMSQLITLYMAGHEPTAGLIGNGILALLAPARPARAPPRRTRPAAQRRVRAAPLRRAEPVRAAHHHPADASSAASSCPPARCSSSAWPRPTATPAGGGRPPTRSWSTGPTPTSTCSSAAAPTPASARTSPGSRPSCSSRALLDRLDGLELAGRARVEHPHVHPRPQRTSGPVLDHVPRDVRRPTASVPIPPSPSTTCSASSHPAHPGPKHRRSSHAGAPRRVRVHRHLHGGAIATLVDLACASRRRAAATSTRKTNR